MCIIKCLWSKQHEYSRHSEITLNRSHAELELVAAINIGAHLYRVFEENIHISEPIIVGMTDSESLIYALN